jgi:two-component system sensor histidine kinase HydH
VTSESSRLEFLGQLAGGLAHEIKNPLSTMRLHLELMQEDLQAEAAASETGKSRDTPAAQPARHLRKVDLLLKEVRRLEDVVQEFLRVSRGHDLKLAAVELGHSLEELIELVRPEAEKSGVTLHLRVFNKIGAVLVDENYLHRALLNLVQNAIQACIPKGGGRVIIEAGRAKNAVGIAVTDTGVGIADEIRDRIFRAYFTSRPGGTGMGLPIARRIIEEHGGFISVDSVVGQGSRFMVVLPVSPGDPLTQMVVHGAPGSRPEPSENEPRDGGAYPGEPEPINVSAVVNRVLAESKEPSHGAG